MDDHNIVRGDITRIVYDKDEFPAGPLAQGGRDVAAVYRGDACGGLGLERQVDEGLGDVLGPDLAAEQIARHVLILADAAGHGPALDHFTGEQV